MKSANTGIIQQVAICSAVSKQLGGITLISKEDCIDQGGVQQGTL